MTGVEGDNRARRLCPAIATHDGEQHDGDDRPSGEVGQAIVGRCMNPKLAQCHRQGAFAVEDDTVAIEGDVGGAIAGLPGNICEDVIHPELPGLHHMAGNHLLITRQGEGGRLLGGCRHIVNHHQPDEAIRYIDVGVWHSPTKHAFRLRLALDGKKTNEAIVVTNIHGIRRECGGAK